MILILSDVNLYAIEFSPNARNLIFKFINMDDGTEIADITCESVYFFNYNNTFEDDDGLACYVGEVTCERIDQNMTQEWLNRKNFGFSNMNGSTYLPTNSALINLHIEGSEIIIDLACEIVKKNGVLIND